MRKNKSLNLSILESRVRPLGWRTIPIPAIFYSVAYVVVMHQITADKIIWSNTSEIVSIPTGLALFSFGLIGMASLLTYVYSIGIWVSHSRWRYSHVNPSVALGLADTVPQQKLSELLFYPSIALIDAIAIGAISIAAPFLITETGGSHFLEWMLRIVIGSSAVLVFSVYLFYDSAKKISKEKLEHSTPPGLIDMNSTHAEILAARKSVIRVAKMRIRRAPITAQMGKLFIPWYKDLTHLREENTSRVLFFLESGNKLRPSRQILDVQRFSFGFLSGAGFVAVSLAALGLWLVIDDVPAKRIIVMLFVSLIFGPIALVLSIYNFITIEFRRVRTSAHLAERLVNTQSTAGEKGLKKRLLGFTSARPNLRVLFVFRVSLLNTKSRPTDD